MQTILVTGGLGFLKKLLKKNSHLDAQKSLINIDSSHSSNFYNTKIFPK